MYDKDDGMTMKDGRKFMKIILWLNSLAKDVWLSIRYQEFANQSTALISFVIYLYTILLLVIFSQFTTRHFTKCLLENIWHTISDWTQSNKEEQLSSSLLYINDSHGFLSSKLFFFISLGSTYNQWRRCVTTRERFI
jgi:hypothetical protein